MWKTNIHAINRREDYDLISRRPSLILASSVVAPRSVNSKAPNSPTQWQHLGEGYWSNSGLNLQPFVNSYEIRLLQYIFMRCPFCQAIFVVQIFLKMHYSIWFHVPSQTQTTPRSFCFLGIFPYFKWNTTLQFHAMNKLRREKTVKYWFINEPMVKQNAY